MKAIVISHAGGPEVLEYKETEIPKAAAGKLLVRVQAAGVNYIDIYRRNGRYPVSFPSIAGLEGTGVIEQVGPGVSDFKVGERVSYTGQPGSYAQFSVIDSSAAIAVPDELSVEHAAAFPLQGMTAHYLVHEFRHVKAGDHALVHAAAGGMGLLLTQWLKHMGAHVIGTVSTEQKAELSRHAGADNVIIYTKIDFVQEVKRITNGKGVELIIDGVGKTTFTKDLDAAAVCGTIVIFGASSGMAEPVAPNSLQAKSITVCGGALGNYTRDRQELARRANDVLNGIKEGWLKLTIGRRIPLRDARTAHELLESRQSTGKIVLVVEE